MILADLKQEKHTPMFLLLCSHYFALRSKFRFRVRLGWFAYLNFFLWYSSLTWLFNSSLINYFLKQIGTVLLICVSFLHVLSALSPLIVLSLQLFVKLKLHVRPSLTLCYGFTTLLITLLYFTLPCDKSSVLGFDSAGLHIIITFIVIFFMDLIISFIDHLLLKPD